MNLMSFSYEKRVYTMLSFNWVEHLEEQQHKSIEFEFCFVRKEEHVYMVGMEEFYSMYMHS